MPSDIGDIKIEKNPWMILFLLLISILGLLVNGYRYGVSDQALYIPMIDRAVNPELFPNDYLFDEPSGEYNFWIPAMSILARFFSLEWIFFVGYVLTRFGLFWAIYHLSLNLFDSRGAAVLAVLFLITPKSVGGTATATQDTFFTLRSTAMPFAIAFLIPYFRGRLIPAAIICSVAFLIHPITAIPLVGLLALRLLIDGFRGDWRTPAKAFGIFLICVLPLFVRVFLINHANPSDLSLLSRSHPQWLEIIKRRDSYIFLSVWNRDAFQSVIVNLTILLAILLFRRWHSTSNNGLIRETDWWAFGVILVCLSLFIIGGVFVEWYPLPLVVQLQVLRSLYLLVNLSQIYLAWMLIDRIGGVRVKLASFLTKRKIKQIATGGLIAVTLTLIVPNLPKLREGQAMSHVNLPGALPRSDWIDVGLWCQANTPIDAVFFVPIHVLGFRIHSRRSSVGNWKDGAPCVFSEHYAKKWWARMEELKGYDSFNEGRFNQLKEKYRASFAVTRKGQRLRFPILYENNGFVVYALN